LQKKRIGTGNASAYITILKYKKLSKSSVNSYLFFTASFVHFPFEVFCGVGNNGIHRSLSVDESVEEKYDEIVDKIDLDMRLYVFVRESLSQRYREKYASSLRTDVSGVSVLVR